VTQDDLLYRFRPRVFAIAAELGTVRAAGRAMGIIPRHITAEAAAGPPRPGDPGARPLPQRAAAQDRAGEMRFLTPANLVDLAEAIPARYRALVFVGAYGGPPAGATPKGGHRARGHTSVSFTLAAAATRRSPGRSGRAGAIR
jgi:hypothetical protein